VETGPGCIIFSGLKSSSRILVLDMAGRLAEELETDDGEAIWSCGTYPSGVYLYAVRDREGEISACGCVTVR
jgi:hypothetical protein